MKTDERNKFVIKSFLGEYLDLRKDKDNELATVDSIRKGVEFKGANLWILIFAIFMASLGLNVNSTAVIIGAMLISPLMGPIMGVGLSVGLNDFELMKRSLKSFLITTAFSVTTATIFFLLAPIAGSQSELLARMSNSVKRNRDRGRSVKLRMWMFCRKQSGEALSGMLHQWKPAGLPDQNAQLYPGRCPERAGFRARAGCHSGETVWHR